VEPHVHAVLTEIDRVAVAQHDGLAASASNDEGSRASPPGSLPTRTYPVRTGSCGACRFESGSS
jgi:hypothetical protein